MFFMYIYIYICVNIYIYIYIYVFWKSQLASHLICRMTVELMFENFYQLNLQFNKIPELESGIVCNCHVTADII